jgi:hypothetical protein
VARSAPRRPRYAAAPRASRRELASRRRERRAAWSDRVPYRGPARNPVRNPLPNPLRSGFRRIRSGFAGGGWRAIRQAGPHHGSPIDTRPADEAALAPRLASPPGMTRPSLARLRATAPVRRTPGGLWILTRHADVAAVLRNQRFGREGFERYFGMGGGSAATSAGDGLTHASCPATTGSRCSSATRRTTRGSATR